MTSYGVIFDMDGVLVDSYRTHFESWNRMLSARGLSMTEEQFAATFGRTSREIIRELWPEHVGGDEQVSQWDAEKEAAYRDALRADCPAMDGATELITALSAAGFALAIGSSGPPENVAAVLECLPGAECFSAAVDGTQVSRGKPDPQVFLRAAKKIDVAPHRCAVVEDAPAGIEAARRAGMAAVALTGTAPREALAADAHLVVDSLRELQPDCIRQLIDAAACGPGGLVRDRQGRYNPPVDQAPGAACGDEQRSCGSGR